ncbi:hypothetical protein [Sediminispirochaeta smaragdinae]|jgi:hypothetical protein|uniref:Lipoprotein n=1 Tax=Sediminispirochaeta smaragdinae (strain DSM 11293 / JCM 15392 / SEBR 4228) TaxID=573413 RepID=E1R170_SEDSS|nr:hypothetical protein [Sediminispirochaeta smaragdinae]ADK80890.1 hypothetical protein Spirs_1764 [Sediminispirochaeta smaragdinae DSM 11293]
MKSKTRYLLLFFLLPLFGGCSTLFNPSSISKLQKISPIEEEVTVYPGTIALSFSGEKPPAEKTARDAMLMELGTRYTLQEEEALYRLDLRIDQRDIVKDFRKIHAVSLGCQLTDQANGKVVRRYFFSEETEHTIESASYLYRIVRKGVKTVVR